MISWNLLTLSNYLWLNLSEGGEFILKTAHDTPLSVREVHSEAFKIFSEKIRCLTFQGWEKNSETDILNAFFL